MNDGYGGGNPSKKEPWYPSGRMIAVGAVTFVGLGTLALCLAPGLLLNEWLPNSKVDERFKLLGTAAQIVLFGLGGVIGVIGVALSLARHGHERQAARLELERANRELDLAELQQKNHQLELSKEESRSAEAQNRHLAELDLALRDRFVVAVDLISSDSATKQSAGLYALAALADDWIGAHRLDEAQVCVDVFCSFLRTGLHPTTSAKAGAQREVRQAGFTMIRRRFADSPADHRTWDGLVLDLHGMIIDYPVHLGFMTMRNVTLNLVGATISGQTGYLELFDLTLEGSSRINLDRTRVIDGGLLSCDSFIMNDQSRIHANRLAIRNSSAEFVGNMLYGSSRLSLTRVELTGDSKMYIGAVGRYGSILCAGMEITDQSAVHWDLDSETPATWAGTKIRDQGQLSLPDVTLSVETATSEPDEEIIRSKYLGNREYGWLSPGLVEIKAGDLNRASTIGSIDWEKSPTSAGE